MKLKLRGMLLGVVLLIAFGPASLAIGNGGGVDVPEASSPTSSHILDPPSTSECNRDANGSAAYLPASGLFPECVVVDPGDRVSWTNTAEKGHDPGDGTLSQSSANCWSASEWAHPLGTTDNFSAEFHYEVSEFYDEETVILEDIRYNGGPVEDVEICDPDRTEFTENEDGDIAIRYKCYEHINDPSGAGWIILDI